jgi:DNA-binding beta-propeller fold protein YncE
MLNKWLLKKNSFALLLTFLPVAFSTLLPGPSQGAEMPIYERLQPVTSYITGAIDVATDQSDNLYVADSAKDSVIIFDEFGQYSAVLPGLSFPLCVAVNSAGNIYVGNKETANVEVYDSNHSFLHKLGSGDGEFSQPNDLAIAATGQIYVVDRGADVVKIYNSNGTYSTSFGSFGSGDGEFHRPVSIAIDENRQELIVLDLQLLLTDGIWIDGARLQVFDMNGVFQRGITKLELPAIKARDLYKPQRVMVDGQSRLYVTDARRNVVQVYDSIDFTYLGTVYDLEDPMRIPVGITLGGNDLLYIASRGSSYVDVYQLGEIVQASSSSSNLDSLGASPSTFTQSAIPNCR